MNENDPHNHLHNHHVTSSNQDSTLRPKRKYTKQKDKEKQTTLKRVKNNTLYSTGLLIDANSDKTTRTDEDDDNSPPLSCSSGVSSTSSPLSSSSSSSSSSASTSLLTPYSTTTTTTNVIVVVNTSQTEMFQQQSEIGSGNGYNAQFGGHLNQSKKI